MGVIWTWVANNAATVGGWVVTLIVAVAGWVITGMRIRKQDAASIDIKQDEINASKMRENLLKRQLEALQGQVDQSKEANRLFAEANPRDSDPWGSAINVRGNKYRIVNEGDRAATVESVHADDEQLPFFPDRETPFECGPGDGIDFFVVGTSEGKAAAVIEWHFSGEGNRTSRRPV